MSRLKKLFDLSWPERLFLARAVVGLVRVGLLLRFFGFPRTLARLRRTSESPRTTPPPTRAAAWARDRARLIAVASHHGLYRATCLRRSLYLWWLLRRRGLNPELRIGAKRSEDHELLAHAWIELDGEVVNDDDRFVADYAAFDGRALPERVSWS